MTFARKINKIPEFYMIFARKNARIFHNNCPKNIFFSNFRGARAPPPFSYACLQLTGYELCTGASFLQNWCCVYNGATEEHQAFSLFKITWKLCSSSLFEL